MTEHVQVLTTVSSEEEAGRIAALLVERRLAACVQAHSYDEPEIVAGSAGYLAWIGENVS